MESLEWPVALVPEIRTAGRFVFADREFQVTHRGQAHALHQHDYAAEVRLAGVQITLEPGDLTLSAAGQPSYYHLPRPGHHWCVHFRLPPAPGAASIMLPIHLRLGEGSGSVRERMAQIATLHGRAAQPGTTGLLASASAGVALQSLLLWLAERNETATALHGVDGAVDRIAAMIDARFDEPLSMAALAHDSGFSRNHLARRFKERFGVTIAHRLIQRRVEHARFLLEGTDLPIWRVAERAGIPDAHHFNKTIKRLLGASPSLVRALAGQAVLVDPDQ